MTIGVKKESPLNINLYAKDGFFEGIFSSGILGFLLRTQIMQETDEFAGFQRYGQEITVPFTKQIKGPGKTGGETLEGNEKTIELDHFKMRIDKTRQAAIVPGLTNLAQIRTSVNFEDAARRTLPDWHLKHLDTSIFNHLCGNTSTTLSLDGYAYDNDNKFQLTGHNEVTAPTEGRIFRPGGKTTDESLSAGDILTLDFLQQAVVNSASQGMPLTPTLKENDGFIVIVSEAQALALKQEANARGIALAKIEAGKDNFIEKAYPYPYTSPRPVVSVNGFDIYQHKYISQGVHSTSAVPVPSVHRAVVLGKNAIAFGSKYPIKSFAGATASHNVPLEYSEPLKRDYAEYVSFATSMIYGVKKYVFDGQDYGTIVLPSFVG